MNAIRFNQKMFGLSNRVVEDANDIVKRVAARAFDTLIDDTPVDTGRAVSNWRVGLNYEPRGEIQAFVPGTKASTASANRNAARAAGHTRIFARFTGETIYIVNNLRYITFLNQGWSDQAPAGYVDRAVDAANAELRAARLLRGA